MGAGLWSGNLELQGTTTEAASLLQLGLHWYGVTSALLSLSIKARRLGQIQSEHNWNPPLNVGTIK